MKRRNVVNLSCRLANLSGIDANTVYDWLIDVGRLYSKDPGKLRFSAVRGCVYDCDHPHENRLEKFIATVNSEVYNGPDYEGMILVRQEKWMD